LIDSEPVLVEFRHEEKDFGDLRSSGLGLGSYLLAGLKLRFRRISLSFVMRADFANIELKPQRGNITNKLGFYIGTVGMRIGTGGVK